MLNWSKTMLPGSNKAIKNGCTCAIIDNNYGKGRYGNGDKYGWFITSGCKIHDNKIKVCDKK